MSVRPASLLLLSLVLGPLPSPAEESPPPEDDAESARLDDLEARVELLEALAESDPPPLPTPPPDLPTALNPRITVFGNAVYRADSREVLGEEGRRVDDRFSLCETEIDFRASVDPFVLGVVTVALEEEAPGEFHVGIEEGYALVKSLPLPVLESPPLGLSLKAGRFRAHFGRLNVVHTHDLPQSTRPLVHAGVLGEEGAIGDGLSAQVFLPFAWLDPLTTVQLTAQVFSGPLAFSDGNTQALAHLAWSRPVFDDHWFEVAGLFHVGHTAGAAEPLLDRTWSVDLLYQWRPVGASTYRGFVLGAQWLSAQRFGAAASGFYAFAQVQLSRALLFGVRVEESSSLEDAGLLRSGTAYVSWYATEFFRLRLGYQHTLFFEPREADLGTVWLEMNFVFGSHPAEPYWVHR